MNARTSRSAVEGNGKESPAIAALEAWVNVNRPMMAAISELNGRFIEQVSKANNEWLGFINRRLSEDIAASQRLMECKTLQDVVAAYSEFFQRAQAQYQAEFQYFSRLNQKLADETATVINNHIETATRELRH